MRIVICVGVNGKTAVEFAQWYPVFIQARELADLTSLENTEKFGLPENWVEMIARLADHKRVVLLIDSLDVLSISREHKALDYFLRQLDRLISIPNVNIIAACRDFDVKYDSRLAARTWSQTIQLQGLRWENDVSPLLRNIGIDPATVAPDTKELLKNPRELVLYADLALDGGNLNVLTSEELTSNYLKKRVEDNPKLGISALIAIENMANTMTETRSLSIAAQKVQIEPGIKRQLLSDMVILETRNNQLTFGHQTLLDALVISHGMRNGKSLTEFIQALAPVPFVRPFIRKYVKLLALGERKEFRKHLRLAFNTAFPFHIHRLIAECVAEMKPEEGDWPLLNHLRIKQPDVFQMLYSKATDPDWLPFWDQYLVPALEAEDDKDKLISHAHFISRWKHSQAESVCGFWNRIHSRGILSGERFGNLVSMAVYDLKDYEISPFIPVVIAVVDSKEKCFELGSIVARCVRLNFISDKVLWNYVIGFVKNDDLLRLDLAQKLCCKPNEFGSRDEHFLKHRMCGSSRLLDMAIDTLESWSQTRSEQAGYKHDKVNFLFLHSTSQEDKYQKQDRHHVNGLGFLLRIIESAVVHNAETCSNWWVANRERLSKSKEATLIYFAILGFMKAPEHNINEISALLMESSLYESSLSFELGSLIQRALIYLDEVAQRHIQNRILTVYSQYDTEPESREFVLKKRAILLLAIPCHLRFEESAQLIADYSKLTWPLIRQADIRKWGGTVKEPFSYDVFLNFSNSEVLRILHHYKDYEGRFSDDLTGGREQVAHILTNAVSRLPSKFIPLLYEDWENIPEYFRTSILRGLSEHINYLHGNTNPASSWSSLETVGIRKILDAILGILKLHQDYWQKKWEFSDAIKSCSFVIDDENEVKKLLTLIAEFEHPKEFDDHEDPLTEGLNNCFGRFAEALMIMSNRLMEKGLPRGKELDSFLLAFSQIQEPISTG